MKRSLKSSLFPDLNVWIALTSTQHIHYGCAHRWYEALPDDAHLYFCRFTQMGFLRLLTTQAVIGNDVLTQAAAWHVYDKWLLVGGASYLEESRLMEDVFRSLTQSHAASPKDWADSYIAAFAQSAELSVVTFDRGFRGKIQDLILLQP